MSAAPEMASTPSDSQKLRESPNTTMHRPNKPTASSRVRPTPSRSGVRVSQSDIASAHGRRAAQQAQAPGVCVQDVAREDRQQRHRAAQQHREQVERDGG